MQRYKIPPAPTVSFDRVVDRVILKGPGPQD
jgi:hypothetical protein